MKKVIHGHHRLSMHGKNAAADVNVQNLSPTFEDMWEQKEKGEQEDEDEKAPAHLP